MPKVIKFDASALPNTRAKGNIRIGANSYDYGNSYYSMIEPPDGGYTVYENKASGGPSIRVANNEAELINLTRESSGTTYASAAECLAWFATQTDKAIISSNDVFPNTITDGLVLELNASNLASYPGSGTTWYDLSGNGNNVTLTNGPSFSSNNGGVLIFDGVDDYADIPFDSSLNNNYTTLSVWVKSTFEVGPSGRHYILDGVSHNSMIFVDEPNEINFVVITSAGVKYAIYDNEITSQDTWINIVGTYDGSNLKLYVNGDLKTTESHSGNINNADSTGRIMDYRANGYEVEGNLSSVKIYNRALTSDEVLQNYYGGPIVTDDLVLTLDAGNLVSYPRSGTTWSDLSGNDNDGTLTNGPTFDSGNGGSIVFDDTDDYVTIGNPSITQYTYTDDFSLEVWINPDTVSGFKHLIGKSYGNYRLAQNGTGVSFRLDTNVLVTQSGTLVIGKWTHIVATYEASTKTARVYQDGVLVQTSSNSNLDWTSGSGNFQLGNSPGENYYFGGKIALGRAYSKKLTDAEVLQNYNAQRNRFGI
jgi:hypothetical protein